MRVGIIGLGMVGKEILLNLYYFSGVQEIVVYDLNTERVTAEINDFEDTRAIPLSPHHKKLILAKDYSELSDCSIVIINVSIKTKNMSDRIAILADNEALMKEIGPKVAKYSPNARVIITSNPVDAITYFFQKYSGMDPRHVIGSGTILDSARLSLFLAKHYKVSELAINAWVLGEHGKTSFIPWSLVRIAGMSLSEFEKASGISPINQKETLERVIARGLEIFNTRGYTDHGIGASVFRLFTAIAQDEKAVLPVTCPFTGQYGIKDVHMGALSIVGSEGIEKVLELPLEDSALKAYHESADFLKSAIETLGKR